MQAGARKRTPEGSPDGTGPRSSEDNGLIAGTVIGGRFRLVAPLDTRRRVWRAEDSAGLSVALKAGHPQLIESEFRVLSELIHPSIVRAHDVVLDDSGSFLVLEHLPGGDLVSLAGSRNLAWLEPIRRLADTLGWLHQRGIVHRDIKPRNVLFDAGQAVRLIDFGSARTVGSVWGIDGTTVVHPGRTNGPVTVADDVYAFACLVHEMLYGKPPGTGEGRPLPASAAAVAEWVELATAAPDPATVPGLDGFRTVIESTSASS